EPLGGVIGTMLFDRLLELKAGEELQQLREDARKSLHGRASLGDCVLAEINLTQVCPGRALLIPTASRRPNRQFSEKLFWTRVMSTSSPIEVTGSPALSGGVRVTLGAPGERNSWLLQDGAERVGKDTQPLPGRDGLPGI